MYSKDLLKNQAYLNYITNNHVKVFHHFFIISLFFPLFFSFKSNNTLGRQHRGGGGAGEGHGVLSPSPHFFAQQKEKRKTKEKKRVLKQKLLNGCDQDQDVTVLVSLGRLQNSETFLIGQPWWPAVVFSVPCPVHFEINFAAPATWQTSVYSQSLTILEFNSCNYHQLLIL